MGLGQTIGRKSCAPQASDVQMRLAREIVDYANSVGLATGTHLREEELAKQFGLSRSPVRGALALLHARGIVAHHVNRGYFLVADAASDTIDIGALPTPDDDALYDEVARAWFRGEIPEQVSESHLRRQFESGRPSLARVLKRLSHDGIIRSSPGNGWQLEPSLSTRAAFEESYEFRMVIEPAAILSASFVLDQVEARRIRRVHEKVIASDPATCRLKTLVEADLDFHAFIGRSSRNQFFVQSIERQNALRRLMEQQATLTAGRLHQSCAEHLTILDAIESGKRDKAARLMRQHLSVSQEFRPDYRA